MADSGQAQETFKLPTQRGLPRVIGLGHDGQLAADYLSELVILGAGSSRTLPKRELGDMPVLAFSSDGKLLLKRFPSAVSWRRFYAEVLDLSSEKTSTILNPEVQISSVAMIDDRRLAAVIGPTVAVIPLTGAAPYLAHQVQGSDKPDIQLTTAGQLVIATRYSRVVHDLASRTDKSWDTPWHFFSPLAVSLDGSRTERSDGVLDSQTGALVFKHKPSLGTQLGERRSFLSRRNAARGHLRRAAEQSAGTETGDDLRLGALQLGTGHFTISHVSRCSAASSTSPSTTSGRCASASAIVRCCSG